MDASDENKSNWMRWAVLHDSLDVFQCNVSSFVHLEKMFFIHACDLVKYFDTFFPVLFQVCDLHK